MLAIFAHPDDIEFRAAGTMLLLRDAGYELHYHTVASGNCGSLTTSSKETAAIRALEAQDAAKQLGAQWFPPLANDLEITYEVPLLRRLVSIVRAVNPRIVLTHALADYMEDHMITARLAVTAAFSKGIPNFASDPPHASVTGDVTVYHAMPHGLRDPLGHSVRPHAVVNTSSVHAVKRKALAAHRSQKDWLDQTQGMDSYLVSMDHESQEIAQLATAAFQFGEGWHRHSHMGFSASDIDILAEVLPDRFHAL